MTTQAETKLISAANTGIFRQLFGQKGHFFGCRSPQKPIFGLPYPAPHVMFLKSETSPTGSRCPALITRGQNTTFFALSWNFWAIFWLASWHFLNYDCSWFVWRVQEYLVFPKAICFAIATPDLEFFSGRRIFLVADHTHPKHVATVLGGFSCAFSSAWSRSTNTSVPTVGDGNIVYICLLTNSRF